MGLFLSLGQKSPSKFRKTGDTSITGLAKKSNSGKTSNTSITGFADVGFRTYFRPKILVFPVLRNFEGKMFFFVRHVHLIGVTSNVIENLLRIASAGRPVSLRLRSSSLPQTQKCQRRLCRKAAAGALVRLPALLIGGVVVGRGVILR